MQGFFAAVLDLIIPPRRTELILRALTIETLQALRLEISASRNIAPLPYHDPRITALVWELKYHGSPRAAELGGVLLAEELLALAAEELGRPILIPIPIHPNRHRERGFNQTELLCMHAMRALSAVGGQKVFEYAPQALARIKNTPRQQGLERAKRLHNLKGSMRAAGPDRIAGRICVVLDDVTTTGATFAEARRALKAAGTLRVHCVALAQS